MISLILTNARIQPDAGNPGRWWVMHPQNDAILAYCDTRNEAERVVDAFNVLANQLAMAAPIKSKCERCSLVHAESPHPCPFKQEIHNDATTLCSCCETCQTECSRDI